MHGAAQTEAFSFAAGSASAVSIKGNSTASAAGVIASPKPTSICNGMRALSRNAKSVIRTPSASFCSALVGPPRFKSTSIVSLGLPS